MASELIFVHGAYFSRNFGDTLLIEYCRRLAVRERPNARVVFPMAPEGSMIDYPNVSRGFSLLDRPSAIIFAGGGYLGEPPNATFRWYVNCMRRYCALGLWAQMKGIPYALIGIGAGPIANRVLDRMIGNLVSHAELVTVRDQESSDFLVGSGADVRCVRVTTDLANDRCFLRSFAGLLPPEQSCPVKKHTWDIVVHITALLDRPEGAMILASIECMLRKHLIARVHFVHDSPWPIELERKLSEFLVRQDKSVLQRTQIHAYRGPAALLRLLIDCDAVLTSKLHVGIVGCALGKSVLSFPTHLKTPRYYRHIGASERCITVSDLNQARTWNEIQSFLQPGASPVQLPAQVANMANVNRDMLVEFLRF